MKNKINTLLKCKNRAFMRHHRSIMKYLFDDDDIIAGDRRKVVGGLFAAFNNNKIFGVKK